MSIIVFPDIPLLPLIKLLQIMFRRAIAEGYTQPLLLTVKKPELCHEGGREYLSTCVSHLMPIHIEI
jgi:hypothetical protein